MRVPPPDLAMAPVPEMAEDTVAKSRPVVPLSLTLNSRQPSPLTVRATPVPAMVGFWEM